MKRSIASSGERAREGVAGRAPPLRGAVMGLFGLVDALETMDAERVLVEALTFLRIGI